MTEALALFRARIHRFRGKIAFRLRRRVNGYKCADKRVSYRFGVLTWITRASSSRDTTAVHREYQPGQMAFSHTHSTDHDHAEHEHDHEAELRWLVVTTAVVVFSLLAADLYLVGQ